MTPELRKMAEDAGIYANDPIDYADLERFARLVAEDCAKVCSAYGKERGNQKPEPESEWPPTRLYGELGRAAGAGDCSLAIRAKYGVWK